MMDPLQRISEALEQIEALIAQIRTSIDLANTQGKLH